MVAPSARGQVSQTVDSRLRESSMTDRTEADHIREMCTTFDSKDVPTVAAFVADDIQSHLANAEPTQGRSACVTAVNEFLASVAGVRHEVANVWSDGAAVLAEFDVHHTGRRVRQATC